jgi:hypothetical protein
MKYIVGAGIGGLFGLSAPFMMEIDKIEDDNDSRQEESQPQEEESTISSEAWLILPDDYCSYILYESEDLKEQAKECLRRSIIAVPAI